MSAILIALGIILALIFFKHVLYAIVGAILWGFVGSFFGDKGMAIGVIVGLIAGIVGASEDNKKRNANKEQVNPQSDPTPEPDPPPNTPPPKNPTTQIISCPSCSQRISVNLPLKGSIGKCTKCSTRFSIILDQNGKVIVEDISRDKVSPNENAPLTTQAAFEVLDISRDSTSDQIKIAYKKKIRQYHPDMVEKLGPKIQELAVVESTKINNAYELLKRNGYV